MSTTYQEPIDCFSSNECVGEMYFNSMKNKNENYVICINGSTGEEYTYKQLLQWSVRFATYLKQQGIKKGDTVAVVSNISVNSFIAILATFYVGATICPINPTYSLDELEHCLSISKPSAILLMSEVMKNVEELTRRLAFIKTLILLNTEDGGTTVFEELKEENIESFIPEIVDPNEIAAIFMSSGTSGSPKGVMLTHNNIKFGMSYIRNPEFNKFTEGDSTIMCIPMFHIMGFMASLNMMVLQVKLVFMERFKPKLFLEIIQKYKITILVLAPPLAIFLAKSPMVVDYDLSSVDDIFCGGAPLCKNVSDSIRERLHVPFVRQIYALTETTGTGTITPRSIPPDGSVGKAIPGCRIIIKDTETGRELPANKIGEICVLSAGVMKGYKGYELDTPDNGFDKEGYLHTGDIGYFNEEGYLFIVDRIKELIKYKAFQVAPASIENVLLKHPKILEAAVVGKADEESGEVAVAFIIRANNVKVTEKEIIEYVADRVSKPSQLHGGVIFVDQIPKNPAGKISRKILREKLLNLE